MIAMIRSGGRFECDVHFRSDVAIWTYEFDLAWLINHVEVGVRSVRAFVGAVHGFKTEAHFVTRLHGNLGGVIPSSGIHIATITGRGVVPTGRSGWLRPVIRRAVFRKEDGTVIKPSDVITRAFGGGGIMILADDDKAEEVQYQIAMRGLV